MGNATKIWLIIAAALVLVGSALFVAVMAVNGWNFSKLSTVKYCTNTYEITEDFSDISVDTDTAEIVFLPSEDEKCKVVCYEEEKLVHSVSVKDDKLSIDLIDTRRWYDYIGISFGSTKITVYLPMGEYEKLSIKESTGDVEIAKDFKFESIDILASTADVINRASASEFIKIRTSTGDISIEGVDAGSIELSVSTGRINVTSVVCAGMLEADVSTGKSYFTDVTCGGFDSAGDTGDIFLKNVVVSGKLDIERSTGDVSLERCDAAEISIETDTGDVEGSLLSEKVFVTVTDTGRVDVPLSVSGGLCKISTDTGDIKIEID